MSIMVEKQAFEFKGKEYFEYFIKGNVRGRDVKVKLAPPDKTDKGAFTVLDIVFGDSNKAEFAVVPYEFQDSTGKTIVGNKFFVRTTDAETGEIYECQVKPAKQSDKTLLAMLMR